MRGRGWNIGRGEGGILRDIEREKTGLQILRDRETVPAHSL